MGPMAVVAVTHSSLYCPVEGQEEDLGTMARSCWEERTKEAVVRGRRADSAVRRMRGRMVVACLLAYLLYQRFPLSVRLTRRSFFYPKEETENLFFTRPQRPSRSSSPHQ